VPSFTTGRVSAILSSRPGLQRVEVDLGSGPERAYVLTTLTPPVAVGDEVVVNTTAVELGLGTGGWHVVHWNLALRSWHAPGPGHIMKLRYTSLQVDVGTAEEHLGTPAEPGTDLEGMPVVVVPLHSQLAAAAVAATVDRPGSRVAYVMTDGAALPAALSDLLAALRERALLCGVVTAGHAFGGDLEAVSIPSALWLARRELGADLTLVGMGPGIVGTGTALGTTGVEAAATLDTAAALGGRPVACLRMSAADPRPRHRGLSHHSRTVLRLLCRSRTLVPVPALADAAPVVAALHGTGITARHDVRLVPPVGITDHLDALGLAVSSMGRPAAADPLLFEAAAVAARAAFDPHSGRPVPEQTSAGRACEDGLPTRRDPATEEDHHS